jgi:methylated-DNA-[protein]-cysteine S-methyltransferase
MPGRDPGDLLAASYPTPAGTLTVVVDPHAVGDLGPKGYGAVVLGTFRDLREESGRLPQGRRVHPRTRIPEITDVLTRYADGDLHALDEVSVVQPGGPFQQAVWRAMRRVRAGGIETYGGLARRAGRGRASRAAGTACAINLVALFVPCHRIVASNGLGGYGYGLDIKVALLEHEGVLL